MGSLKVKVAFNLQNNLPYRLIWFKIAVSIPGNYWIRLDRVAG